MPLPAILSLLVFVFQDAVQTRVSIRSLQGGERREQILTCLWLEGENKFQCFGHFYIDALLLNTTACIFLSTDVLFTTKL